MVTFSGSLLAPFSATKGAECFIIREAQRDELKTIGWAAAEAFIHDAIAHYFSGTTKPMSVMNKADLRALYDLYYFVVKACMIGGGRVVVAVHVPTIEGSSGSKAATTIAAVVCWYPPRKRISALNAIRGGILRCLRNWGLKGLKRMSEEYSDTTHGVFEQAFSSKAIEKPSSGVGIGRQNKGTVLLESDSWYVQLVFSSKQYEGRGGYPSSMPSGLSFDDLYLGLMSILMREGFAYAHSFTPGIPVTLDATSSRARDRYMHLGFELMEPQTLIGVGKASSRGIAPLKNNPGYGNELTGVPYWCMVNLACTVGASELVARERGEHCS
ncbi:hypothetical protein C8R41DRAFT_155248 [Lentinula lateritia]|uniref:Uncharacterized protein n=1 Tax=Lentinula lateritia TaxID=40482 RepID=A0ABQ8UXU9_9AGAR|nr:hypothetical protein C8R41DRAFT_155248 [Lentinula lateritia]